MSDRDPQTGYLVSVRLSQTEALQNFLRDLGSTMDPKRDCAYPAERGTQGIPRIVMGQDVVELHSGISEYLRDGDIEPMFPESPHIWNIEQISSFLELAVLHFDWRDGRPAGTWWEREAVPWRQVIQDFPALFNIRAGE